MSRTSKGYSIIHNDSVIKADFIIRKDEPYRRLEFKRRRYVPIQDHTIAVVAPEDLILSKLYWAKDSESELQQRDVRVLVDSIQDLDWPYLDRWAETLGVSALLERSKST